MIDKKFKIANKIFKSRLIVGTGKYKSFSECAKAIKISGADIVTVAVRDALDIFKGKIIELHISNIYKREEFRHKSIISGVVTGIICGLGVNGYILAINSMHEMLNEDK